MLVISSTETEWREIPDPPRPDKMTARVISPCTIHNLPRSVGELVEVDANTLRNLIAKGRLEEYVATPVTAEEITADINSLPSVEFDDSIDVTDHFATPGEALPAGVEAVAVRRGPGRPRKNPLP